MNQYILKSWYDYISQNPEVRFDFQTEPTIHDLLNSINRSGLTVQPDDPKLISLNYLFSYMDARSPFYILCGKPLAETEEDVHAEFYDDPIVHSNKIVGDFHWYYKNPNVLNLWASALETIQQAPCLEWAILFTNWDESPPQMLHEFYEENKDTNLMVDYLPSEKDVVFGFQYKPYYRIFRVLNAANALKSVQHYLGLYTHSQKALMDNNYRLFGISYTKHFY